jgi:hypothetical protein
MIVKDRLDRHVVLFPNQRSKGFALDRNPNHTLLEMG